MQKEIEMVAEFHRKSGNTNRTSFDYPLSPELKLLRVRLMLGELAETTDSLAENDLTEIADGLCDLLYTVFGTALSIGLAPILSELFAEVHRSNMTKAAMPPSENGNRVLFKGPEYEPPRLAEILDDYRDRLRAIDEAK